MNHQKILLSVPLIVLTVFSLALVTPSAHAQFTGLICIADNSTSNCPSSPPVFTGPTGSQLTVAVNIQGSDQFNTIEIHVQTNPNVLYPASVDVETNSVLAQNSGFGLYWFGCVNGTPTNSSVGNACSSPPEGPGIVDLTVAALGGVTPNPTTGHLFSITYNIISGSSTDVIGYSVGSKGEGGCDPSSVQGTFTCVQVVNPAGPSGATFDPETVQAAGFNQSIAPPSFNINANPTSFTMKSETSRNSTVTITSVNGFNGPVTLSATVSPVLRHGLTVSLSPASITVPTNGQASSTLTATAAGSTQMGTYTVTITATGGGITKQTTVTVTVTAG